MAVPLRNALGAVMSCQLVSVTGADPEHVNLPGSALTTSVLGDSRAAKTSEVLFLADYSDASKGVLDILAEMGKITVEDVRQALKLYLNK